MRTLLALILSALTVPAAVHVQWNFTDFTSSPHQVKRVYITPIASYTASGTNIVTGDRITYTNTSVGGLVVSNMVLGAYRVELAGPFRNTTFTNTFSTAVAGLLNAADAAYLGVSTNLASSSYAYSQAAADARFAPIGASGLSNVTETASAVTVVTNLAVAGSISGNGEGVTNLARVSITNGGALSTNDYPRIHSWPRAREAASKVPIMGVMSWYGPAANVTEDWMISQIEPAATNFARFGYRWMLIDAGWGAAARDANGNLWWDTNKFPNGIPYLAERCHTNGLMLGLYTEPLDATSFGHPGSGPAYLERDARLWSGWGIDYIKLDTQADEIQPAEWETFIRRFLNAWDATGKPVYMMGTLFNITNGNHASRWEPWVTEAYNEWRTANSPDWQSMTGEPSWTYSSVNYHNWLQRHIWEAAGRAKYTRPGFVPSFDTLPSNLAEGSYTELFYQTRTILTMGAMNCASRILNAFPDPASMPVGNWLLTNQMAIDILLDPAVIGPTVYTNAINPEATVWARPLGGASSWTKAVALYNVQSNTTPVATNITVVLTEIGYPPNVPLRLTDCWSNTVEYVTNTFTKAVRYRTSEMYKIEPATMLLETLGTVTAAGNLALAGSASVGTNLTLVGGLAGATNDLTISNYNGFLKIRDGEGDVLATVTDTGSVEASGFIGGGLDTTTQTWTNTSGAVVVDGVILTNGCGIFDATTGIQIGTGRLIGGTGYLMLAGTTSFYSSDSKVSMSMYGFRVNNALYGYYLSSGGSGLFGQDVSTVLIRTNATIAASLTVGSNVVITATGAGETNRTAISGAAQFFSATNGAGVAEMFVQSDDGQETLISPHSLSAPALLYDRAGDKEYVVMEANPFTTNGSVTFMNLRRALRLQEITMKAVLYLAGKTSAGNSNSLERLKALTNDERQLIVTETYAEHNARTGAKLQPLVWANVEQSRQDAYDAERLFAAQQAEWLAATNVLLTAEGRTNELVTVPTVPPVRDVRRPKPSWLK